MNAHALEFRVVVESSGETNAVLRPEDVEVSPAGTAGNFGKFEVELAAGKLVQFFQARGGWVTFTITELAAFYKRKKWDPNFMFFGLLGPWYDDSLGLALMGSPWKESEIYVVQGSDGRYRVTDLFLKRLEPAS